MNFLPYHLVWVIFKYLKEVFKRNKSKQFLISKGWEQKQNYYFTNNKRSTYTRPDNPLIVVVIQCQSTAKGQQNKQWFRWGIWGSCKQLPYIICQVKPHSYSGLWPDIQIYNTRNETYIDMCLYTVIRLIWFSKKYLLLEYIGKEKDYILLSMINR